MSVTVNGVEVSLALEATGEFRAAREANRRKRRS